MRSLSSLFLSANLAFLLALSDITWLFTPVTVSRRCVPACTGNAGPIPGSKYFEL